MNIEHSIAAQKIFNHITLMMSEEEKPPTSPLGLGFWLSKRLTLEELTILSALEAQFGGKACNQQMVQALVRSGKWRSDDGKSVEAID